jgi:hypothetical protein
MQTLINQIYATKKSVYKRLMEASILFILKLIYSKLYIN